MKIIKMHFVKKIVLILMSSLLVLSSSFLASAIAMAEDSPSTWYNQGFPDWHNKVYDDSNPSEIFGERYTAAQVEWILYSLFSFILHNVSDRETSVKCIGGDTVACGEAITQSIQKIQDLTPQGYMPNLNNKSLASMIFAKRGFSGIQYVNEKISKFTLVSNVNAQGFGFNALDPIQGLWSASRNIAYSLAVFAVLILAFMIMFRVKISPQIVISAQSAIPKVIAALVFVTFSYAIAGFLIDLMYVIIGFLSLGFSQFIGTPQYIFTFMTDGALGFGGFLVNIGVYTVLFMGALILTLFLSGNIALNIVNFGSITLIYLLLVIILAIVMLFITFKVFWLLIKTLAQTYLLVIVGPLQIMMGTVTQGLGVGSWLKSLAANLAVYPLVGSFFFLAFVFMFYAFQLGLGNLFGSQTFIIGLAVKFFGAEVPFPQASWSPPLTLAANQMPLAFLGISFVMITLIPKSVEIIQGFITGKPFAYGSAIGEAMQPVGAIWKNTGGRYIEDIRRSRSEKAFREGEDWGNRTIDQILTWLKLRKPSPSDPVKAN